MMSAQNVKANERRAQTQEWINKLVSERQEMLVQYAGLAGLEPYTSDKPVDSSVRDFCQILMDYMAAGHFGLYERINSGEERRQAVVSLSAKLFPRISDITKTAVEFNDFYDQPENRQSPPELPKHLSTLGERLAERIEMEDQLISTLLSR